MSYIYQTQSGDSLTFSIEGKQYRFKGGYYQGKKTDSKNLSKVNSAYPILDEEGNIVNTGQNEPAEKAVQPPEPSPRSDGDGG